MNELINFFKIKSNLISLIVVLILTFGLLVALLLIKNPQIFRSKAATTPIEFFGNNTFLIFVGKLGFTKINGQPTIGVKLASPWDTNAAVGTQVFTASVTPSVSCVGSPSAPAVGQTVTWNATVLGGTSPYNYTWSGDGGLTRVASSNLATDSINIAYTSAGIKTANISVFFNNQVKTASCTVSVGSTASPSPSAGAFTGTCHAYNAQGTPITTAALFQSVNWKAIISPAGNYTYTWSGSDGLSGSGGNEITGSYDTAGVKTAQVLVFANNISKTITCTSLTVGSGTTPAPSTNTGGGTLGVQSILGSCSGSLRMVTITWNALSGASYYTLTRNGIAVGGNVTTTSYSQDVNAGSSYTYIVTARNSFGTAMGTGQTTINATACGSTPAPSTNTGGTGTCNVSGPASLTTGVASGQYTNIGQLSCSGRSCSWGACEYGSYFGCDQTSQVIYPGGSGGSFSFTPQFLGDHSVWLNVRDLAGNFLTRCTKTVSVSDLSQPSPTPIATPLPSVSQSNSPSPTPLGSTNPTFSPTPLPSNLSSASPLPSAGGPLPTIVAVANASSPSECLTELNKSGFFFILYNPSLNVQEINWDLLSGVHSTGTRKTVCAKFLVNGTFTPPIFAQIDLVTGTTSPSPASSTNPNPSSSLTPNNSSSPQPSSSTTPSRFATDYRLAESITAVTSAPWQPFNTSPTYLNYTFQNTSFGVKQLCTQFKASDGTLSAISCASAELIDPPQITGCNLTLGTGYVNFELTGKNFGIETGYGDANLKPFKVISWTDAKVVARLDNPPVGDTFTINLIHGSNLMKATGQCSAISQLNITARLFCPQISQADFPAEFKLKNLDNIQVPLVSQTVTLNRTGLITGLNTKLEEGKKYRMAIRVPRSVWRSADFVAVKDTTNVELTSREKSQLPLGDIFPLIQADGTINTLDKSELNREWVSSVSKSGRPGDLNSDGRVNTFDWACMKQDFGARDDDF